MLRHKAFKYRIYPTEEQKIFLAQHFGCARFVYNYFLNNRDIEYKKNKTISSYYRDRELLINLKNDKNYTWLKNVNSQTLQDSVKYLDNAYNRFYKKKSKFPKFHKKSNKQSITISQNFKIKNGKLFIPKLKTGIKIVFDRKLPKKLGTLYISKNPSNQYFASFRCEVDIKPLPILNNSVGLDLGIKDLIISSNRR